MRLLLLITALIEGTAGLVLLVAPSAGVSLLLGMPLDTSAGLVVGRIGGAALVAFAIVCWKARRGERGSLSTAVVQAVMFYNFAALAVLVYAGIRLEMRSPLLWPAILLHLGMGAWCSLNLWVTRRRLEGAPQD